MIHTPKNNRMKQEEIRLLYQRFEQMACVSGDVDVLPSMPETDSSATTKVTIDKSHPLILNAWNEKHWTLYLTATDTRHSCKRGWQKRWLLGGRETIINIHT